MLMFGILLFDGGVGLVWGLLVALFGVANSGYLGLLLLFTEKVILVVWALVLNAMLRVCKW